MNYRLLLGSLALLAFVGAGCARTTQAPPVSESPAVENSAPVPAVSPDPVLAAETPSSTPRALAPEPPRMPPPPAAPVRAKEENVYMTPQGFVPSALKITAGTTVHFLNQDPVPHWPASGVHPAHDICRGFDSLKPLANGEKFSFTFTEKKTCPMHDHLKPTMRGSIVVE